MESGSLISPQRTLSTTEHSSQPTLPLAETWELLSLSRLACNPYYKHLGCKIIQCPRTPPLLDVRPRGRNQDKTVRYCDCLLHHHLGRGNTQHLLVGIQAPRSGHRQCRNKFGSLTFVNGPTKTHIAVERDNTPNSKVKPKYKAYVYKYSNPLRAGYLSLQNTRVQISKLKYRSSALVVTLCKKQFYILCVYIELCRRTP